MHTFYTIPIYTFFTFKNEALGLESDHWQSTLSRHQLREWNHCHVVTRRLVRPRRDNVTKPVPVLVSGRWSRCQVCTLPSGGDCHHSHPHSRVPVTHASADLASYHHWPIVMVVSRGHFTRISWRGFSCFTLVHMIHSDSDAFSRVW